MDENIETVNKYYHEGLTLKNKARKSDEFINDFKKASDSYISAAKIAEEILAKIEDENINFKVRTNALKNYYFYEGYECLYAYNYKNDLFDEALENAKSAKKHIDEAIRIVDENIDKLNDDVRTFLLQQKNNWQLSQLTVQLREVEPIGKRAMKNRDYITALDSYRKMSKLQDKAHYYVEQSNLPEVFKRTEKGNHLAAKASIAMTLAGIYIEKSSKNDYNKDILEQFLEAMHYIKLAQVSNPEQDKYKEGYESTEQNIKKILTKNKEKWFEYLTEFNNNKNYETNR